MSRSEYDSTELYYHYLKITAEILACSELGSRVVLKGGLALLCELYESNHLNLAMRGTKDMDLHVSDFADLDYFTANCERVLNMNNRGIAFKLLTCKKNTDHSRSVTLLVKEGTVELNLGIDINLGDRNQIQVTPSCLGLQRYNCYTMLSDKICVLHTPKIQRRVKDLLDIYTLASAVEFKYSILYSLIMTRHPEVFTSQYNVFADPAMMANLEHAYSRLKGLKSSVPFNDIARIAQRVITPLHAKVLGDMIWSNGSWRSL